MAVRATSSLIGDLGELGADRLVLDDAAPALHAHLRVVERGLVGGAADAEVERRNLRERRARRAGAGPCAFRAEQIVRGGTRQSLNSTSPQAP